MKNKCNIFVILCLLILGLTGCSDKSNELKVVHLDEEQSSTVISDTEGDKSGAIYAYIYGQVNCPGVYEITDDTRLFQLVEKAGGFTNDAADYLNLASIVSDGQQIKVLSKKEYKKQEETQESETYKEDGKSGKININYATAEELKSLPGIGEAKAKAIVSYREENGAFATISDVMNVSGIGQALFANIKEYITV